MTVTRSESADNGSDDKLRRRTALAREGNWLALLVAGVVVLAAMPYYHFLGAGSHSTGCTSNGSGFICHTNFYSNGFFGIGLGSSAPGIFGNSSPSATTYWVASIFLGLCAVVGFYWFQSRKYGTTQIAWPIMTIGFGVLALFAASRDWFSLVPADMTIRGMQALLIIALGLFVLAVINRTWAFSFFIAGFVGLALLSCLYDVSNLFNRIGIGSNLSSNDQTLPNLILPGFYLLIGAAAFWAVGRRSLHAKGNKSQRVSD